MRVHWKTFVAVLWLMAFSVALGMVIGTLAVMPR